MVALTHFLGLGLILYVLPLNMVRLFADML